MRIGRWLLSLIVSIAILLTLASFAFNAVTSDANVPVTQLWHGSFVTTNGYLTAYRKWGSHGTPIVLVGGLMEPSFVWDGVAPLLAQNHRVYALDLDGFGYTERHGPWTLTEWGDQVQAFLKALSIDRPVAVGHSLGAAVAVEAARRGLVSRIVLLDGDAVSGGGPPGWVRSGLLHTPFFTSALRIATRWQWPVKRVLANAYGPGHPKFTGALVHQWTDQLRAQGARGALRGLLGHGIAGFDRKVLRAVRVHTTVVWGEHDSVDSRSSGQATASDLHARFVVIPGAGHLSMLGAPQAVARAIARG